MGSFKDKLDSKVGLTFDDLLISPSESTVEPEEANVNGKFSKNIELKIPVSSAAMDTVTEAEMAATMAIQGGIGIIHRNISSGSQTEEIKKAKEKDSLVTRDVVTASPKQSVEDAFDLMENENVSGLPVVDDGDLVGIISRRDLRPLGRNEKAGRKINVSEVMTQEVVTAKEGVDAEEALDIMHENRVERLPVVENGSVLGIVTMDNALRRTEERNVVRNDKGEILVGAAVSPFDPETAFELEEAGADVLVVDTAHAHNKNVIEGAKEIKNSSDIDIVVGNIATKKAAEEISFADGIKVGVGPGSICTTRVVAGAGVPQMTAIAEVADVASEYDIPVIADGGIRYSGDIAKAIGAGANCVMIGSLLAGTDEAPGRTTTVEGKRYKKYRGMGSVGALTSDEDEGSSDRYLRTEDFVPEGVEGAVPYRGSVEEQLSQLVGGVRSGMGYVGAKDLYEMREKAEFIRITDAGRKESHPHDIVITDEAPNYNT